MSTTHRDRFETYQRRYREAFTAQQDFRQALNRKYGSDGSSCAWALKSERTRLDRLSAHAMKCGDLVIAFVIAQSPRGRAWRYGAPYHWICMELSWEDVRTAGALSVVPPLCYGQSERDRASFGAALQVVAA